MAESDHDHGLFSPCGDSESARRIQSLREDLPWLCHDEESDFLFCKTCVDGGLDCYFSTDASKNLLMEHESSAQHVSISSSSPSPMDSTENTSMLNDNICHFPDVKLEPESVSDENREMEFEYEELPSEMLANTEENSSDSENDSFEIHDSINVECFNNIELPSVSYKNNRKFKGRRFCMRWLTEFPWLLFKQKENVMYCKLCLKHSTNSTSHNTFIKGSQFFKVESIRSHAGSVDHQFAENCEKLTGAPKQNHDSHPKKEITAKQKFLLKKYLQMYPWLVYRADVQMLTCEICQRYATNKLFIDVGNDIHHEIIQHHVTLKLHQVAEETEVKSWSLMWDIMTSHGMSTDSLIKDRIVNEHLLQRTAALFKNTSVNVVGSAPELSVCNSNSSMTRNDLVKIKDSMNADQLNSFAPPPSNPKVSMRTKHLHDHLKRRSSLQPFFGAFRTKWLGEFSWLEFDKKNNLMFCKICRKRNKKVSFAQGVRNYSRSCVVSHSVMKKHLEAVEAEKSDTSAAVDHGDKSSLDQSNTKDGQNQNLETNGGIVQSSTSQNMTLLIIPSFSGSSNSSRAVVLDSPLTNNANTPKPAAANPKPSEQPEVCSTNTPPSPETSDATTNADDKGTPQKRVRTYYPNWEKEFPWVRYNKEQNNMVCIWCIKYSMKNAFAKGCRSFHKDSLRIHDGSITHQRAAQLEHL